METQDMTVTEKMLAVITTGDLRGLTDYEKVVWYRVRCEAAGVDWRTNPFQYITLNGKLVLYPKLECAQQIASNKGISTLITDRSILGEAFCVTCRASDPLGRAADSMGAVYIKGLSGEAYCNALLKAESKARRRAVMALCGLGGTDDEDMQALGGERVTLNHAEPLAITSGQAQETRTIKTTDPESDEANDGWGKSRTLTLRAWESVGLPVEAAGLKLLTDASGVECTDFYADFKAFDSEQLRCVKEYARAHRDANAPKPAEPQPTEDASVPPPAVTVQGEEKEDCGKVKHYTPAAAEAHKIELQSSPDYVCPDGKTLNTYLCKQCSVDKYPVWHVGHTAQDVPNPDGPMFPAQRESILRLSDIHNRTVPEDLDSFTWSQARVLLVELNSIPQINPPPRTQKKEKANPPAVKVPADPAEYVKLLESQWVKCFRTPEIARTKLSELMGEEGKSIMYWCLDPESGKLIGPNCRAIADEINRIGAESK